MVWLLVGILLGVAVVFIGWAIRDYRRMIQKSDKNREERQWDEDDLGGNSKVTSAEDERTKIRDRFSFHPATAATGPKHDEVRKQCQELALWLIANVPPSRERSLALTAAQEVMMWSNAAVAIYTEPEPDGPLDRA